MGAGIKETAPLNQLEETVKTAIKKGKKVHFLPPYRPETRLKLAQLLDLNPDIMGDSASKQLIKEVVAQRSVKIDEEIDEMEKAHSISYEMHTTAMKMAKAGCTMHPILPGHSLSVGNLLKDKKKYTR